MPKHGLHARPGSASSTEQGHTAAVNRSSRPPAKGMVWVPGATFTMGSDHHYPEEAPAHQVTVSGFWIDQYAVTNKQFQRFVKATGYVTIAERSPNPDDYPGAIPELLVPGSLVFQPPGPPVNQGVTWWNYVPGANWRHPEGAGSSIKGRDNHPVVHVAYTDAEAYAVWSGKSLPTEAQWESAARGGLESAVYAWGNEWMPKGKPLANIWHGEFPWQNLKPRSPGAEAVGSYPPNGYGVHDMIGNVWEWTADWYRGTHSGSETKACCIPIDPHGGSQAESYDPNEAIVQMPRKVLKGGSFLCAPNYCRRYRPAARHPETVDTSTCHIGFRCVVNTTINREIKQP